jgi:UDP-GlcNAc:undecaprenyl-phosphate/decaprenyl-phosphate GlcNAc-1-phosphate transferase
MNYTPLLIFLTSFIISVASVPSIIRVAKEKMLFDKPTEKRKIHTKSIPNLGGIAIFLGFYFSILMFRILCESMELSVLCAASVLLFFVALKDDLISTAPILRLFYQFLIAFIIVVVGQIYFSHLPFSEYEGLFFKSINILFSVVFVVAIINALNFIDGVDGLSGSVGIFTLITFALIFQMYGETTYALIALGLAGSTLGFLVFNWNPAKIFMGDIGSMLLGVFLAVFAIKLCNLEPLRLGLIPIKHPSTLALALLIIPIMDMVCVVILRLSLKLSPFNADKRHTHHRLLALGFSQKAVTLTLVCFNLFVVLFAFSISLIINGILSFIAVVLIAVAFELTLIYLHRKKNESNFL